MPTCSARWWTVCFDLPLEQLGTVTVWLAVILYSFQIYYDFSGYSDMAIGLGRMFGFTYKENFNYPYLSASVSEFWSAGISPSPPAASCRGSGNLRRRAFL